MLSSQFSKKCMAAIIKKRFKKKKCCFSTIYDMLIVAYVKGFTSHLIDCKETARQKI